MATCIKGACTGGCTGCAGSCTATCRPYCGTDCTGCGWGCSYTCNGCSGGCQGCTGSCSGGCQGCTGSCSGGCQGCTGSCTGCTGTCIGECTGCTGTCTGCTASCTGQCNSGCSSEANATAYAALGLQDFIKASDLTNIRSVVVAVAKRISSDISSTPTYTAGATATYSGPSDLATHLTNLGFAPSGNATQNGTIAKTFGQSLVDKAKAAYAHVYGLS